MSQKDKIAQNRDILRSYYDAGLSPAEAYGAFRGGGGAWRKQDFLNAYRQYTQQPKAPYNIGRAAPEHKAKYEKKKAKKRVAEAKKVKAPAKARTPARKKKEARHKAAKGITASGAEYEIKAGVDVSVPYKGKVNFPELIEDLKQAGIRFFDPEGGDTMILARDGERQTVHLYGTAVYEAKNDRGGRPVGLARQLIDRTMKAIRTKKESGRKIAKDQRKL